MMPLRTTRPIRLMTPMKAVKPKGKPCHEEPEERAEEAQGHRQHDEERLAVPVELEEQDQVDERRRSRPASGRGRRTARPSPRFSPPYSTRDTGVSARDRRRNARPGAGRRSRSTPMATSTRTVSVRTPLRRTMASSFQDGRSVASCSRGTAPEEGRRDVLLPEAPRGSPSRCGSSASSTRTG